MAIPRWCDSHRGCQTRKTGCRCAPGPAQARPAKPVRAGCRLRGRSLRDARAIANPSWVAFLAPFVDGYLSRHLGAAQRKLLVAILVAGAADAESADHLAGTAQRPTSVQRGQLGICPISHAAAVVANLQPPH